MKILLILASVIVLLMVVVVGVGALLPKHHVASRRATYRATPEQLFALIAGPQNWRPDVKHSETSTGPDGEHLLTETTGSGTMTYEIAYADPPHSLVRRIYGKNLPFSGSWTYSLTAAPSGATVRITEDADIYNPVFRFMSRFVLGYTQTMDTYLRALGTATGETVQIED